MQGVYVNGNRPKTKKALREALGSSPETVVLEATSMFGNEYGGPLSVASDGVYYVVGPDPHMARRWYASLTVKGGKVTMR